MRTGKRVARWAWRMRWMAGSACAALACASMGVRTDYDREFRFGTQRSYDWVDSTHAVHDTSASPFLERRVRRAVDQALQARGFVSVEEAPDFLVTAFVIGPTAADRRWQSWPVSPCSPMVSFTFGFGYPYGYGLRHPRWPWRSPFYYSPWGYACGYRVGYGYLWIPVYTDPGSRLAGTLVIDLLDPVTREPIWRGSAEGAVGGYPERGASQEELDQIATRILREFPPDSGD